MQLHNFYSFTAIKNCEDVRDRVLARGREMKILGTILLAPEGINAALYGSDAHTRVFLSFLEHKLGTALQSFITPFSDDESAPFHKLKVRVKPEIVALGLPSLNPGSISCAIGTHVDPWEWNELIEDPHTLALDTRNTYEYCLGHFKNAVNPDTTVFKEFPDYVHTLLQHTAADFENTSHAHKTRVAMYCTGGIRCEKASAFLKARNFSEVYQLRGGILEYLRVMPPEHNLWIGGCFVFDDRVVIDSAMRPMPVQFSDIPKILQNYRTTSGHANHIYTKITSRMNEAAAR